MSGIEIAGVILGLWPIISNLAAAYKDTKTGEDLKRFIKQVAVSEALYKGQLRALLLCDDKLSEEEISTLLDSIEDAATAWQQPHVQSRLRACLGGKTCDSINTTLTEIHDAMQILESNLRKGEVDMTSVRNRMRTALRQARARRPNSEFQHALERLEKNVQALGGLVSVSERPLRYRRNRVEKVRDRRTSEVTRNRRIAAGNTETFYEAIKAGFQDCSCDEGHDTSLRVNCDDYFDVFLRACVDDLGGVAGLSLQTRSTFDTAVSTLDGGAQTEDDESPMDELQPSLLFPVEKDSRLPEITTCWSSKSGNDSASSSQQSQHAVQFTFSTDNPRATGSSLRSVLDLCMVLKNLSPTPPNSPQSREPMSSFGTLRRGESIFTARGEPKILPPVTITCLDDCLAHLCQSRARKRVEIAQNLAFAVVQFWSTHWIDEFWTWRNFSVRDDAQGPQLFITRRILPDQAEQSPTRTPDKFWRFIGEPMLVRLGFALVELALGQRLSEWRLKNGEDETKEEFTEDEKDYFTAQRVLDSKVLEDDLGRTYQTVVEACMRCEVPRDGAFVTLTRRAPTFQQDVDLHVVQPLQHYFETTWGTVQA